MVDTLSRLLERRSAVLTDTILHLDYFYLMKHAYRVVEAGTK
jgi:hypothetical protein